ncbi:unnamed protein product [Didymodactylos carnosus]|uniref:Uncharacterized protein n=1 Tax=Didymodactylos carnosus TaxID=1234261 RepID=A0A816EWD4_9BILA|nr:unnamed protein product [Didymodactylos carnosus]CAF1654844.1 unnamed protein product [Didymodactylos carnosus]CAF3825425.1 unnamed protein product [Didymodactylos carnosus]CAF4590502.1 unnamed protein product [Didymodactylos carnosus]
MAASPDDPQIYSNYAVDITKNLILCEAIVDDYLVMYYTIVNGTITDKHICQSNIQELIKRAQSYENLFTAIGKHFEVKLERLL